MSLVLCVLLLPHLLNQKSASHSYSTFDGQLCASLLGGGKGEEMKMGEAWGRIPHSEPLRNKMCGKCSLRLVWLLGSYILTIPGTLLLHNDAFTWLHKRRHCGLLPRAAGATGITIVPCMVPLSGLAKQTPWPTSRLLLPALSVSSTVC